MSFYGVKVAEASTVTSPATIGSGIPVVIGTAPVHQVGGTANTIVTAYSYEEAVSALGWSDDWEKYTLCEAVYSRFKLYGLAPLVLINVLDPEASSVISAVEASSMAINSAKQIQLTGDAIASTIVVSSGATTYEAGTDYATFYSGGYCYIEVLEDGAIDSADLTSVTVAYSEISFTAEDMVEAVIGGVNATTGKRTGMELIDNAYYQSKVLPDMILAPGFSQYPAVAAVMAAKAQSFSTVFCAMAICDLDAGEITSKAAAISAKEDEAAFRMENQIVCWPMVKYGERVFHLSTQLADRAAQTDSDSGSVPSESPSNKVLEATGMCLGDGSEVLLDLTEANELRGNGIVTAINFVEGFTAWGSYAACYPDSTDVKDMFINVKRMFVYVSNQIVLKCWSKIDRKMTARLPGAIVDEINIWMNSLVSEGHILGGRAELKSEENTVEDMMAGILKIHVYMTPCTPLQEIDFTVEYDADYATEAYGA